MSSNVHEEHELEALKAWWKEYGVSLLAGGAFAVATLFAWQGWQSYQRSTAESASHLYEFLRVAQEQGKFADVSREAHRLMVEFDKTPYAVGSAFMLAKFYADKQEWADAESNLNWVISNSDESHWQAIAVVRLAKVMMAQNKHQEAVTLLDKHYVTLPEAFRGVADYLKGSALQALGLEREAITAFAKANANPQLATSLRSLSQLWMDDLTQETP